MKVAKRKKNEEEQQQDSGPTSVGAVERTSISAYEEDGLVCLSIGDRKYYLDPEDASDLCAEIEQSAQDAMEDEEEDEDDQEGD